MDNNHILNTVHLQQLKGMRISKLGMWMGYNLSIEGIQQGYLFLSKMVYRRVRGWTLGRSVFV